MRLRLQKILAAAGLGSRRGTEDLLRAGRVRVNGKVAQLGDSADPDVDDVRCDGKPVLAARTTFWMLNKPRDVVTTRRDPEGRRTVLDLLPREARRGGLRLFPVGRLDRATEGLVLLTNDGEVAHALLHPSRGSEREYLVSVRGTPSRETLQRLERGVRLEDGMTAPARVGGIRSDARARTTSFRLTLIEGRKRQIRRVMEALGHPVTALVRIRMGPLKLGRLARGAARPLTPKERRLLLAHARRRGAADRKSP